MRDLKQLVRPNSRIPSDAADKALFTSHYTALQTYTALLQDRRCRTSDRFDSELELTLAPFGPIFMAWNMEILFVLYMNGALRFGRLKAALQPISSRVLTDKLVGLAQQGLISRSEEGKAVRYEITVRGEVVARHLHPLLYFLHNL